MVKLKGKLDKHATDNEKRRQSIKEKEKAKQNQSLIIKQALSNSALNSSTSKKIIFDQESDIEAEPVKETNGNGKNILFGGSSSEDEDFEIKEKTQFSGKKGFELLNLQSTFGNDERFKIDERFLDKEEEEMEGIENEKLGNEVDEEGEKIKQLKILESVLGEPIIKPPESEKKHKKKTYEMIRYDATNKDHEKYEIKQPTKAESSSKKKKERRKLEKILEKDPPKVQVSKEKFYEVSSDIKNSFKESKGENGQFSLLQVYGSEEKDKDEDIDEEWEAEVEEEELGEQEEEIMDFMEETTKSEQIQNTKKNKKVEKKDIEKEINTKSEEKSVAVAKGIWKESFFFGPDDPRFKEGLEFINKKNSQEALEAAENYDATRRKLREILRLHAKKQLQKKNPFKKKVGGMNKKQLMNSRFKNSKSISSRRKPNGVNPGVKI